MEEPCDSGVSESRLADAGLWSPDFVEKLQSVKLMPQDDRIPKTDISKETIDYKYSACSLRRYNAWSPQVASQILWATGSYSGHIPNGFYSIVPDRKLKKMFNTIPSLDELSYMGVAGSKAEAILVDVEKDKKLFMLKQLSATLAKGYHSSFASIIKKLARLVCDFYKHSSDQNLPKKCTEKVSQSPENRGFSLLGQIRMSCCRPRAILFKVLADSINLECKLMVGLPPDGLVECMDSYKHLSVVVVLNSVELLVDLTRFPGQLIPFSSEAIFKSHISAAGESDSADNDSCDSPLEPNSPLYGLSEKLDGESPDHPPFRAWGRPILTGSRETVREQFHGAATSRSDGASTTQPRRIRRRSISIAPEIGDDIVRAVRSMNETLKQNKDGGEEDILSYLHTGKHSSSVISSTSSTNKSNTSSNEKSTSLSSSPCELGVDTSERNEVAEIQKVDLLTTWNSVLQSSAFVDHPLLPFAEWHVDYSELTVGTRVGIGFFGEVFRGIWNGTDVAIKVFLEQDLTAEHMKIFCNEVSILSRLRHPNVISFLGATIKPPRLSVVTEYMEMGSLHHIVHTSGQKEKLSWHRRIKILQDICRGLVYIHRMKIVHRDIKSANCLVDRHWTVKICDFGLSQMMTVAPMRDGSSAGTPEWMAPELIRNEPFSEKCDIFSLGVIMWELSTLSRPWKGVPPVQVVHAVANEGTRLDIPEGPLAKLIADCWAEPDERPSCRNVLSRLLDCEYSLLL